MPLVCIMLQFAKTKTKTRKNLILYYANFTNSIARNACIYAYNQRLYVDIQLFATSTNDVIAHRYKIITRDYNRVLFYDKSQFDEILNLLIKYAYETKY